MDAERKVDRGVSPRFWLALWVPHWGRVRGMTQADKDKEDLHTFFSGFVWGIGLAVFVMLLA